MKSVSAHHGALRALVGGGDDVKAAAEACERLGHVVAHGCPLARHRLLLRQRLRQICAALLVCLLQVHSTRYASAGIAEHP